MEGTLKKVREVFTTELATDGDVWRILKKGTLVDLIKLDFFYFQKERSEKHLIDLFNHSMKVKLLSRINAIEVKGNFEDISKYFNQESEFVLSQYTALLNELYPAFKNYEAATLYDLNEKIQYIKVVNELEIDTYSDEIFEEIIGITINILNNKRY